MVWQVRKERRPTLPPLCFPHSTRRTLGVAPATQAQEQEAKEEAQMWRIWHTDARDNGDSLHKGF